jgi:hypothetical protein
VTPILRATVPAMRAAKEAHGEARQQLREPLAELLVLMQQLDLLDVDAPGARARSVSEDVRTKRPPSSAKAS